MLNKSNFYNYPWPHWIIDDFFNTDDFSTLTTDVLNEIKTIDIDNPTSLIEKNHGIYIIRDGDIKNKRWYHLAEKYSKKLNNFKDFNVPIRSYNNLTFRAQLTIGKPECNYPVHYEVKCNILKFFLYLYPKEGIGTKLYLEDESYALPIHIKTIDWKQNKLFVFPPQKNVTWHSYEGDNKNLRISLIMSFIDEELDSYNENFYKHIE